MISFHQLTYKVSLGVFQIQEIFRDANSDAMIRNIIQNLPEDLNITYQRLVSKTGRYHNTAKVAERVFRWTISAKRPLHVDELGEAVSFDPKDTTWDAGIIVDEKRMFEPCGGFFNNDKLNGTLRVAHHTVQ